MGDFQHPDMSMTSLAAAQANTLAGVTGQLAGMNENIRSNYLTKFSNWALSVSVGRAPNTDPPVPPKAYVVGYFVDPTSTIATGDIKWAYPAQGDEPVCPMPPIPETPKPYVPPVVVEPENIRNVPVGDTMPVGFVLNAPDGKRWQKQASPTPFGIAYYYTRLA